MNRFSAMTAALASALLAAGCTTASLEDAAPRSTSASQPMPAPARPGEAATAADATGASPAGAFPDTPQAPGNEAPVQATSTAGSVPRTTADGFANINAVPDEAAPPLSDTEKEILRLQLAQALARQQAAGGRLSGADAAEIARLRRLARLHGVRALEEIEGE